MVAKHRNRSTLWLLRLRSVYKTATCNQVRASINSYFHPGRARQTERSLALAREAWLPISASPIIDRAAKGTKAMIRMQFAGMRIRQNTAK
ncbi:hypothetical protein GCM10027266_04850 [Arenimonas alkanexedens]